MPAPTSHVGERIRFHRVAAQRTQAVVAGLAGISENYLSQVERGLKVPAFVTLQRIADALRLPVTSLVTATADAGVVTATADVSAVRRAMATSSIRAGHRDPVDVESLGAWVGRAWERWQRSSRRYSETTSLLPGLIEDTDTAMLASRPADDNGFRRARAVAADLNFLLRSFCRRTGQVDLVLLAADRGIRLATEADDDLRTAAGHWNLCHALMASDAAAEAEAVALLALGRVARWARPEDHDAMAVGGALHLVASESTALQGNADSAHQHLGEAARAASLVGERNTCWMAFGPTNVAIHAVHVELVLGKVHTALRMADDVDTASVASIERRLTFLLGIAACHERRNEDAAVLGRLLEAEQVAAEDLGLNSLARELVDGLVARGRRSSAPAVRGLASRIGVLSST